MQAVNAAASALSRFSVILLR